MRVALFQFATNAVGKVPGLFENMLVLYLLNGLERAMGLQVIDLNPPVMPGEIISLTELLEEDWVREASQRVEADFFIWGSMVFEPEGQDTITGIEVNMFMASPSDPAPALCSFFFDGLEADLKSSNLSVDMAALEDSIEDMLLSVAAFLGLDPEELNLEKIGEGLTQSHKAMVFFIYALRIAEDPESKLKLYLKAITSDSYFASAYINCAQLLLGESRYGEAMKLLLRAERNLKGSDLEVDILNLLGVSAMHMGMWEEAVKVWGRSLQKREDYVEVLCNLASAYSMREMADESEEHYRKALSFRDDYPLAWFSLGRLLANQGRCEEAETCMRRYVELCPGDPWAYYILGSCLVNNGKSDEAEFALAKATQLDPGGEAGNLARQELYRLRD